MIEVATRFFGLRPGQTTFKAEQGDGGAVVARLAQEGQAYNVVLVDVFAGGSNIPASCCDAAFVGNLRRIIKKGGVALHNMGGSDATSALSRYEKAFGSNFVKLERLTGNDELPSSLIVTRMQ